MSDTMSRHTRFAMGYQTLCDMWDSASDTSTVEIEYEAAKHDFGKWDEGSDAYFLGVITALLHLNGVEL